MSTVLSAETKKSELWIAAGGDTLTSVVSIYYSGTALAGKVVIAGVADKDNKHIANVVSAAIAGQRLTHAIIDAAEMAFVTGRAINSYAIECLLQIILLVANRGATAEVLVPCTYIADVLKDVFGRQKAARPSVTFETAASPELPHPIDRLVFEAGPEPLDSQPLEKPLPRHWKIA